MRSQRNGGLLAGASLAVAACLLGTALASDQGVSAAHAPQALRVVVVGDSLSTGYGTSPSWAWPRLLSAEDPGRVEVVNASENGGGYLAVGDDGGTFGSHAASSVTADTGVVVFFGSENDMGEDPSDVADAAVAALESAHSAAPAAKIVVVGPTAFTDDPEPARLAVRDALESAASRAGDEFVDPLAGHWLASPAFEGPDGDHPTLAGQEQLRDEMVRVLGL